MKTSTYRIPQAKTGKPTTLLTSVRDRSKSKGRAKVSPKTTKAVVKSAPVVAAEPEKPTKTPVVEEVKVEENKNFIEESKAEIDYENEDPIDKILREAEESRLNAERILNADSNSRAEQAAISAKAKFEVDKFKATKEGVAETQ